MRRPLLALLLATTPAAAIVIPAPHPSPDDFRPIIDGRFELLQRQFKQYGLTAPVFGPQGAPEGTDPTGAAALLTFVRPLGPAELRRLTHLGVRLYFGADGAPERLDTRYPAWIPFSALPDLRAFNLLQRAECTWRPITLRPLETVNAELGATRARATTDLDGSGVRIADIDSPVDALHPHLFFADGGWFRWIDVDGNGRLDAGDDGLDLDGDGVLGADERLQRLPGARLNPWAGGEPEGVRGRFDAGRDWLYLDRNGSGEREAGVAEGFSERDWAYGEPVFVGEDLDGDGVLTVGEGLLRLGTSKVARAMYGPTVYVRGGTLGRGIIDSVADQRAVDASHGTGVASIAVGGQAPWHRAVGLAPGAEYLVYANVTGNEGLQTPFEARALIDALDQGAALILHEWTDPFGQPQDGGGEFEAAMASARAQGLAQVNPLGNLNLAGKHVERAAGPGTPFEAGIRVGDGFRYGPQTLPYTIVYGTLMWADDTTSVTVSLTAPGGEAVTIPQNGDPVEIAPEAFAAAIGGTNARGTRWAQIYVYREDVEGGANLPVGDWAVSVDGFSAPTTVYGRVTDYYSSWSPGVGWVAPTEDRGTLVYPATADAAFGVAAYGGVHHLDWDDSAPGELRPYSGRGPRMDGAPAVDLAAPDDPYAALAWTPEAGARGQGRSWFSTFGGTSGAGPHVAGAMALLAQAHPRWGPDELEGHLTATARSAALVPDHGATPNAHWGYGKLDVWGAVIGGERPAGRAPSAALTAERDADALIWFDASDSSDADGDALVYRFDVDGDGTWDTDWQREASSQRALDELPDTPQIARVLVRDATGLRSAATLAYTASELEPPLEPDAARPDPTRPDAALPDLQADQGITVVGGDDDESTGGGRRGGCDAADAPPAAPLALLVLLAPPRRRRQHRD